MTASAQDLILDSLPAHKGKAVKNYVEWTNGKLELHFLPGYAPELNQNEIGVELHEENRNGQEAPGQEFSLHDRIDEQLFQSRWNPALVHCVFKAEDVSYISD